MISKLCLLFALIMCTIIPICNAEEEFMKQTLSMSEKFRKAESLEKINNANTMEHTYRYVMHYKGDEKSATDLGKQHKFDYIKMVS